MAAHEGTSSNPGIGVTGSLARLRGVCEGAVGSGIRPVSGPQSGHAAASPADAIRVGVADHVSYGTKSKPTSAYRVDRAHFGRRDGRHAPGLGCILILDEACGRPEYGRASPPRRRFRRQPWPLGRQPQLVIWTKISVDEDIVSKLARPAHESIREFILDVCRQLDVMFLTRPK